MVKAIIVLIKASGKTFEFVPSVEPGNEKKLSDDITSAEDKRITSAFRDADGSDVFASVSCSSIKIGRKKTKR